MKNSILESLPEFSEEDIADFFLKEDLKEKEKKLLCADINRYFSMLLYEEKNEYLERAFYIKGAYPDKLAYDIYYTAEEYGKELLIDEINYLKLDTRYVSSYYKYYYYIFGMMIGQGSLPFYIIYR